MREMKIARSLSVTLLILLLTPLAGLSQNTKENADFKLAVNLYTDGLFDLAAEQLKQFIDTYPSTAQGIDARFYLGLTQLKLKKYDDARLTFQTFALTYQDNPKAPEAWWNGGESYAAMGSSSVWWARPWMIWASWEEPSGSPRRGARCAIGNSLRAI